MNQLTIDTGLGTITLLNKYHLDCPDQSLNFEIMRPSPLGNPYPLKSKQYPKGYTRDEACDLFKADLWKQIQSRGTDPEPEVQGYVFFELIKLAKLVREGKHITVTCCCISRPGQKPVRCHGESVVGAVTWLAQDKQWDEYCAPFVEDENTSVEVNGDSDGNDFRASYSSSPNIQHSGSIAGGIDARGSQSRGTSTQLRNEQALVCERADSNVRTIADDSSSTRHPGGIFDQVGARSTQSEPEHSGTPDEEDVREELSLNQLVEWKECPDYLKDYRYTRVREILPDGYLKLGFIRNPVRAKDCKPLGEDHPSYEKTVQFWKMYRPVAG